MSLAIDLGIGKDELYDVAQSSTIKGSIQRDYLSAKVYYKTLDVKLIVESPKYSTEGLVAALGGAMSLYLGIAIIMIFELFEMSAIIFGKIWGHYNSHFETKGRTMMQ